MQTSEIQTHRHYLIARLRLDWLIAGIYYSAIDAEEVFGLSCCGCCQTGLAKADTLEIYIERGNTWVLNSVTPQHPIDIRLQAVQRSPRVRNES